MKAILIDVHKQEIKEVDFDGNHKSIYSLIDCNTFDVVGIDNKNTLFIDDEGLLKDDQLYFEYAGDENSVRLGGSALILGYDEEGNSVATTLDVETVKGKVAFLPKGFYIEPRMDFISW